MCIRDRITSIKKFVVISVSNPALLVSLEALLASSLSFCAEVYCIYCLLLQCQCLIAYTPHLHGLCTKGRQMSAGDNLSANAHQQPFQCSLVALCTEYKRYSPLLNTYQLKEVATVQMDETEMNPPLNFSQVVQHYSQQLLLPLRLILQGLVLVLGLKLVAPNMKH
eukprot:TRINITY_DN6728_c0_g1_i1.p2 TRINITY_DN6728_c0_g1~~TRINITY_DN6728_c0_g1_i1.p2  ORF type:complete len:188 (+),score=11.75 TRINITY_DN6728_c0_g1_i1:69-566(+)